MADTKRQAVHSIRGYVYQIARTVLAWLNLPVNEVLYVEGAEDFDQVGDTEAVANQVKALQANVTLRSTDVAETLQNFWNLRELNPGRGFEMRFLTTASAGVEDENPFDGPGLIFWNATRDEPNAAVRTGRSEQLRTFLSTRTVFSAELSNFMRNADADQFFSAFIARLRFETALDDIGDVEQAIRDRLVTLGESFGVPPTAAEETLDTLLATVLRIATSPHDRVLDRSLLLRVFEAHTQVTFPRADFIGRAEISASLERVQRDVLNAVSMTAIRNGTVPVLLPTPQLPERYLSRPDLIEQGLQHLTTDGVLIVAGIVQVGKTLFATEIAQRAGRQWFLLDLSLRSGVESAATLQQASAQVAAVPDVGGVIVDGVPPALAPAAMMGSAFAALRHSVSRRGGAIVLTTRPPLPGAFIDAAELARIEPLTLQPFTPEEVRRFLAERGCPLEHIDQWARMVGSTTGGQPLLVRARVSALESQDFPRPTLEAFFELPPEVAAAQRDIRLTAAETLPDAAFELLARLSVAGHPLPRDVALEIAASEPAIPTPGNQLDRLAAGWLENLGGGWTRPNSVLFSLGKDAYGNAWASRMHGVIARALLDQDELSSIDAAHILHHGLVADDDFALHAVLSAMFSAEREAWVPFADAADHISSIWVGEASRPTKLSRDTRALFRLAQIRVSLIQRGRVLETLMQAFNEEFPRGSADLHVRTTRFLALSEILTQARAVLRIADVVDFADEWASLAAEIAPPNVWASVADDAAHDMVAAIGFMSLAAVLSPQLLDEFLDAVGTRGLDFQRRFLSLIDLDRTYAHGFVQQIWLPHVRDNRDDWEAPLASMRRAFAFASALGLTVLADVFGEAIIRVRAEYADGPEEALKEAATLLRGNAPAEKPDMSAARAECLFLLDAAEAALAIWREVLPTRPWDGVELTPLLDYRRAAQAEAQLSNWSASGDWLLAASARLDATTNGLWKMAAAVDASYASWRGGDRGGSLYALREAIAMLMELRVYDSDARQFMVLKRVGHTVMCMAFLGRPGPNFELPPAAMSSNLDTTIPDGLPQIPATPVSIIVAQALMFEYLVGGDESLGRLYEADLLQSPLVLVRVAASWTAVFRAASAGETTGLVTRIATADTAAADLMDERGQPTTRPFHPAGVRVAFTIGCIVPGLAGAIDARCIAAWRAEANALGLSETLTSTIDNVEALFVTGALPAVAAMTGEHDDLELQVLGTVAYAASTSITPAAWLRIHAVWTNLLLDFPHRELAGEFLGRLLKARWGNYARQRVELLVPSSTIPPLEEALHFTGEPWDRVRRILFAAEPASGAVIPMGLRERLKAV